MRRNLSKYQSVKELVRFCIVGVFCTLLDGGIFYLVRLVAPYLVALVCGYLLSLCMNYYLTVKWTFRVKASTGNAVGVVMAHLFNLFVVRFSLMWLLVEVMGLSDSLAYVPTLAVSVVVNFILVRFAIKYAS